MLLLEKELHLVLALEKQERHFKDLDLFLEVSYVICNGKGLENKDFISDFFLKFIGKTQLLLINFLLKPEKYLIKKLLFYYIFPKYPLSPFFVHPKIIKF